MHGDLCGHISPATPAGKRYFLLLVDDNSRYMWLTLLAMKDQAPTAIKRFRAGVEVETGRKLRLLRTDRGGEFTMATFAEYLRGRRDREAADGAVFSPTERHCQTAQLDDRVHRTQPDEVKGDPGKVLERGVHHRRVPPEQITDEERGRHDSLRGMARIQT